MGLVDIGERAKYRLTTGVKHRFGGSSNPSKRCQKTKRGQILSKFNIKGDF